LTNDQYGKFLEASANDLKGLAEWLLCLVDIKTVANGTTEFTGFQLYEY